MYPQGIHTFGVASSFLTGGKLLTPSCCPCFAQAVPEEAMHSEAKILHCVFRTRQPLLKFVKWPKKALSLVLECFPSNLADNCHILPTLKTIPHFSCPSEFGMLVFFSVLLFRYFVRFLISEMKKSRILIFSANQDFCKRQEGPDSDWN